MKTLWILLTLLTVQALANNAATPPDPVVNALTQLYTYDINRDGKVLTSTTIAEAVNNLIFGIGMSDTGQGRRTLETIGIAIAILGFLLSLYRYNLGLPINLPATLVTFIAALTLAANVFADSSNPRPGFKVSSAIHSAYSQAVNNSASNFAKNVEPKLRMFIATGQQVITEASALIMTIGAVNLGVNLLTSAVANGGLLIRETFNLLNNTGQPNNSNNSQGSNKTWVGEVFKNTKDPLIEGLQQVGKVINQVITQVTSIAMLYSQVMALLTVILAIAIMLFPLAAGFLTISNKPMFGILGTIGTALLMMYFLPGSVAIGLQFASDRPLQAMKSALNAYDAIKKDVLTNMELYQAVARTDGILNELQRCVQLEIELTQAMDAVRNNRTPTNLNNVQSLQRQYNQNNCFNQIKALNQTANLSLLGSISDSIGDALQTTAIEVGSVYVRPVVALTAIGSALFLSAAMVILLFLTLPIVISSVIGGIQGIFRPS